MNHTLKLVMVAVLLFACCACAAPAADDLANGFTVPAESVRPWCYWWWLNGYVTKEGIVRDLDEMREKASMACWYSTRAEGRHPSGPSL